MLVSAATFITLVMLYYHFMLHPITLRAEGNLLIADPICSTMSAPIILHLAWWLLFAPHGTLRYGRDPADPLCRAFCYVAWALLRGAVVAHEYHYDILDAGTSSATARWRLGWPCCYWQWRSSRWCSSPPTDGWRGARQRA